MLPVLTLEGKLTRPVVEQLTQVLGFALGCEDRVGCLCCEWLSLPDDSGLLTWSRSQAERGRLKSTVPCPFASK